MYSLLKIALTSLLLAAPVAASALITLEGKLDATTTTHYILQAKGRYYHIRKNALNELQSERFRKFDAKVSATIPMEAIEAVTTTPTPIAQAPSATPEAKPSKDAGSHDKK